MSVNNRTSRSPTAGQAEAHEGMEKNAYEPIAIIGMDCLVPGANGPEEFWQLLQSEKTAFAEVPQARKQLTGFDANEQDTHRWGGFLSNINQFDATLFGISPREAHSIDPQQRLVLETAWHALESANIAPDSLAGSATGVFIGISWNDYIRIQKNVVEKWDGYSGTGALSLGVAANRLSYCLNLRGPSMGIDTACSSSLVAVHQACRSLANRETNLAIAGGVNLVLSDDYGKILVQAKMLSPTGRCWTFDERADGYVRSEGCGIVILKRLTDAVRDGDRVLAVIRGSAVNQDGHSEGISAPNGAAQQSVIRTALEHAGFPPNTIGYVETHGTGTPLGDATEVGAIRAVLDANNSGSSEPCWLGALKSRIGHLEPASGVAGLIKAILVLQKGVIPPNANFSKLSPKINLDQSRLRLPLEPVQWPTPSNHPRRAGVTSYGFGGTNSHVVLEAFDSSTVDAESSPPRVDNDKQSFLLALSAASQTSLRSLATQYQLLFENINDSNTLDAVCNTANTARARLPERLAIVANSSAEMRSALNQFADGKTNAKVIHGWAKQDSRIAFLFTGQGSQYIGMGQQLYRSEPVFKQRLDLCDEILKPHLKTSILSVIFGSDAAQLDDTRFAQPALLSLQFALVEQWKHWGVQPEFVIGHSIGEAAAAVAAGIMDIETALYIVSERGRLMATAPGKGAMVSVRTNNETVQAVLNQMPEKIDIAGINSPDQTVISGDINAIDKAIEVLTKNGLEVKQLKVSHAFHSSLMEPILPLFKSALASVKLREPTLKIIPTGGETFESMAAPDYWVNQLRTPVRFAAAIRELAALGANTFVEIGPAPVLTSLGKHMLHEGNWLPSLRPHHDDCIQMKSALGELFVNGVDVDLRNLEAHRHIPLTDVPTYPFDHGDYWFTHRDENHLSRSLIKQKKDGLPLLGKRVDIAVDGIDIVCFETTLVSDREAFLLDHRIFGRSIMPAAGYISLVLMAAQRGGLTAETKPLALRSFQFHRPLDLTDNEVRIQTVLQRQASEPLWRARVLAWSEGTGQWELCASGSLDALSSIDTHTNVPIEMDGVATEDVAQFYQYCAERGLQYGEKFQALTALCSNENAMHGQIAMPTGVDGLMPGILHPIILDAAFQGFAKAGLAKSGDHEVALPFEIEALKIYRPSSTKISFEGKLRDQPIQNAPIVVDFLLRDEQGQLIGEVVGLTLMRASKDAIVKSRELAIQRTHIDWITHSARNTTKNATPSERWILFREHTDSKADASEALRRQGLNIIDAGSLDAIDKQRLTSLVVNKDSAVDIVIALDTESPNTETSREVAHGIRLCQALQKFILTLQEVNLPNDIRIVLMTRESTEIEENDASISLAHAGLGGMLRSAAFEYSTLDLQQIDMPSIPQADDWKAMADLLRGCDESLTAIRSGIAHHPRLAPAVVPPKDAAQSLPISGDATYLITGGTGGLGLALTDWLAQLGARHIVLTGRREIPSPEAIVHIDALNARGVAVKVVRADMSNPLDIEHLWNELQQSPWPLKGIFYAAGIVDDKPLPDINPSSWRQVIEAKAEGARHLDRLSRSVALDYFVTFSSIASVFGSAGQCNYAAANAMLDALILERRQRGVSGITINWGAWADVGMASDASLTARFIQQGLPPMKPANALRAFGEALASGDRQTVIAAIDWPVVASNRLGGVVPSVLRNMIRPASVEQAESPALTSLAELLALPEAEAKRKILHGFCGLVSKVLRIDLTNDFKDEHRLAEVNLTALGIDSLMATELRNNVIKWLNIQVPTYQFIGAGKVNGVVDYIYENMLLNSISQSQANVNSKGDEPGDDYEVLVL